LPTRWHKQNREVHGRKNKKQVEDNNRVKGKARGPEKESPCAIETGVGTRQGERIDNRPGKTEIDRPLEYPRLVAGKAQTAVDNQGPDGE
jgi:hypothetical protein